MNVEACCSHVEVLNTIVMKIGIVLQIGQGNKSNHIVNRIANHGNFSFSYKNKRYLTYKKGKKSSYSQSIRGNIKIQ